MGWEQGWGQPNPGQSPDTSHQVWDFFFVCDN